MRYKRKSIVNKDDKFERATANDKVSYRNNERLTDDNIKGHIHADNSQKNDPIFPNPNSKRTSLIAKDNADSPSLNIENAASERQKGLVVPDNVAIDELD